MAEFFFHNVEINSRRMMEMEGIHASPVIASISNIPYSCVCVCGGEGPFEFAYESTIFTSTFFCRYEDSKRLDRWALHLVSTPVPSEQVEGDDEHGY